MTTFDDREEDYEKKFAHEAKMAFKIAMRGHRLLGLWAAEKLGKTGVDADDHAIKVIEFIIDNKGADIVGKLLSDFNQSGIDMNEAAIRAEMQHLHALARQQILGEKK